jgi:hypothetical protein
VAQALPILNPQLDFSFFRHVFLKALAVPLSAAANFRYYTQRTRFISPGLPTSPRAPNKPTHEPRR